MRRRGVDGEGGGGRGCRARFGISRLHTHMYSDTLESRASCLPSENERTTNDEAWHTEVVVRECELCHHDTYMTSCDVTLHPRRGTVHIGTVVPYAATQTLHKEPPDDLSALFDPSAGLRSRTEPERLLLRRRCPS